MKDARRSVAGFRRKVRETAKSMQKFHVVARKVKKPLDNIAKSGKKAYTTLGLMFDRLKLIAATGVVFGAAFKFGQLFKDLEMFDRALRNSQAIMTGVTRGIRKEMRETALEVAKTTRFSAEEAAQAFYYLTSAGLDAAQTIRSLPAVARFGQAGMFNMSRATELLTDAQSALGMKVKDVEQNYKNMIKVSDVLVRATQLADATTEQFATALTTRAASAMKMYNIPLEQGVALLAAYAEAGLKAERGGMAMDIMLRDLSVKVQENAAAFEGAGIKVYNSAGYWRPLPDILTSLEDAYSTLTPKGIKALQMLLGFQQRSIAFQNVTIGMAGHLREWTEVLLAAGGATAKVSADQLTPFQKSWERLEGNIIETGDALSSFIKDAAGSIQVFNELIAALNTLRSEEPGEMSFAEASHTVMRATLKRLREDRQAQRELEIRQAHGTRRPHISGSSRRPVWATGPRPRRERFVFLKERQKAQLNALEAAKQALAEVAAAEKRVAEATRTAKRWFEGTQTSAEKFVGALEDIKRVASEIDFTNFGGVKTLQKQLAAARSTFFRSLGLKEHDAVEELMKRQKAISGAVRGGLLGADEANKFRKQLTEKFIEQMGGTRMPGGGWKFKEAAAKSVEERMAPQRGLISGTQVGGMAGARVLGAASAAQAKELTELQKQTRLLEQIQRDMSGGGMRP